MTADRSSSAAGVLLACSGWGAVGCVQPDCLCPSRGKGVLLECRWLILRACAVVEATSVVRPVFAAATLGAVA